MAIVLSGVVLGGGSSAGEIAIGGTVGDFMLDELGVHIFLEDGVTAILME